MTKIASPNSKRKRMDDCDDTMKDERGGKQVETDDATDEKLSQPPSQQDGTLSKQATEQEQQEEEKMLTPITSEGDMPQKKFYRQRAHCNPLAHNNSFGYPLTPTDIDWTQEHYPNMPKGVVPTVLDIGCGFGGLTIALATLLPNECILGMEIRAKVTEYVRLRILALRKESNNSKNANYGNCSVLRTNSMKYLPNFFHKASLTKLFFCFPDPHFKRKNHGRRIVTKRLLTEYAYLLKEGGKLYCITDVEELHEWHVRECNAHALFQRITDEKQLANDPCVEAMKTTTEESKKVDRNGGDKFYAVYERLDPNKHQSNKEVTPKLTMDNFFDRTERDDEEEEKNNED